MAHIMLCLTYFTLIQGWRLFAPCIEKMPLKLWKYSSTCVQTFSMKKKSYSWRENLLFATRNPIKRLVGDEWNQLTLNYAKKWTIKQQHATLLRQLSRTPILRVLNQITNENGNLCFFHGVSYRRKSSSYPRKLKTTMRRKDYICS